jgi:starch synthase
LPAALRQLDHKILTITPRYDSIDTERLRHTPELGPGEVTIAGRSWNPTVYSDPDSSTLFLDVPGLFDRERFYTDDPDEHLRWVVFQHLALGVTIAAGFKPKIIHCNDWQTGLVPLLTRTRYLELSDVPTLLTIHNLGYQGVFGAATVDDLDIDDVSLLHRDHLDAGWYSFLETGLLHADWISTVSPTYAREIQTPEGGFGLDAILRRRSDRVVGILKRDRHRRVEPEHRPAHPVAVLVTVTVAQRTRQGALLGELGLAYRPQVPVVGIVSRLASQKGFDILGAPLIHFLDSWDFRVVVLGSGEERYASFLRSLQKMNPDSMGFIEGYDNPDGSHDRSRCGPLPDALVV